MQREVDLTRSDSPDFDMKIMLPHHAPRGDLDSLRRKQKLVRRTDNRQFLEMQSSDDIPSSPPVQGSMMPVALNEFVPVAH